MSNAELSTAHDWESLIKKISHTKCRYYFRTSLWRKQTVRIRWEIGAREIEALSEMQTAAAVVGSVWDPILLENSNSFFKEKRFRFSEEFRIHSPKSSRANRELGILYVDVWRGSRALTISQAVLHVRFTSRVHVSCIKGYRHWPPHSIRPVREPGSNYPQAPKHQMQM